MRSRFLAVDYYSAPSPAEILSAFDPISLPSPLLLPPDPPFLLPGLPFPDLDFRIPLQLDEFPFENALSEFFSAVVPVFLPLEDGGAASGSECQGDLDAVLCSEDEIAFPEGIESRLDLLFEVVEVDDLLNKNARSSNGEKGSGLRFEIPDSVLHIESMDIETGITIIYPHKVAKTIFSVENIVVESGVDKECSSLKEGCHPFSDKTENALKLPFFDVKEMDMELETNWTKAPAFTDLFSEVKSWQGSGDGLLVNANEFCTTVSTDIMDDISKCVRVEHSIEHEHASLNSLLDMEVVNLNNQLLVSADSKIYPLVADVHCVHQPCSVHFQEVQILDSSSYVFHIFDGLSTSKLPVMSDKMLDEDMGPVKNLYNSFMSSEIALADEVFKSLPEPIFGDEGLVKSPSRIFRDILCGLKAHRFSSCDGIYLDWHPLLEGLCKREACVSCMYTVEVVNVEDLELHVFREDASIDTVIFYDSQEMLGNLENKEPSMETLSTENYGVTQNVHSTGEHFAGQNGKCETNAVTEKTHGLNVSSERVSLLSSLSQSNDLNYFLDVRRGGCKKSCGDEPRTANKTMPPVALMEEPSEPNASDEAGIQQWKLEIHLVNIPENWLCLLENFRCCYLRILEKCTELRKLLNFLMGGDFESLSIPKQVLLDLITEKSPWQLTSGQRDEIIMASSTLYAIKRLTYFMCFFSIHSAYQYIKNLTRSNGYFAAALKSIESVMEDAFWKAGKQLNESHPLFPFIQEILMSNVPQNGNKVVFVAHRAFWFPLKLKLMSMMIMAEEVDVHKISSHHEGCLEDKVLTSYVLKAILDSDCLLITPEDVWSSFPFDKFSIIMEYGGPQDSSKIVLMPTAPNFPRIYFLKVELEKLGILKALCDGHDVPQNQISATVNFSNQHIVQLLNFLPLDDKHSFASSRSICHDKESTTGIPDLLESKKPSLGMPSLPDIVIIVNTQRFEKNMLFSRRSSYQKILALEKGGAQVIERDIYLPLDVVISAALCLVWYEAKNFVVNAVMEKMPSITSLMENIATNVLMSLSFAFSSCIMIFEGESSFLTSIMESSDALYAAAATLDMNLQLFCSHLPETTDEIILSCIRKAAGSNGGCTFPAMPESETIAESFLTRFPSVNPLLAHAILCSGGTLVDFLEWSSDRRIQSVKKYRVNDESVSLFSTLCRYGEVGESKSVMTDVSSIDSDGNSTSDHPSLRKRMKTEINAYDAVAAAPRNLFNNDFADQFRSESRRQHQDPSGTHSFKDSEPIIMQGGSAKRMKFGNNSDRQIGIKGFDFVHEEAREEVIDHDLVILDRMYHSPTPESISYSRNSDSRSHSAPNRSTLDRKTLSDNSRLGFDFGTSEVDEGRADEWGFFKPPQKSSSGTVGSARDNYMRNRGDLGDYFIQHFRRDDLEPDIEQKEALHCFGNSRPPSSARMANLPPQEPNWTVELLHRVVEKRRARQQQNQHCSTSRDCPGGGTRNGGKQSPSIIDSYRYQGGSQRKKPMKPSCKGVAKLPASSGYQEKDFLFANPTMTPVDKRARQNLSFTRNGNEKQSRLVWRSQHSPCVGLNPRKRCRGDT